MSSISNHTLQIYAKYHDDRLIPEGPNFDTQVAKNKTETTNLFFKIVDQFCQNHNSFESKDIHNLLQQVKQIFQDRLSQDKENIDFQEVVIRCTEAQRELFYDSKVSSSFFGLVGPLKKNIYKIKGTVEDKYLKGFSTKYPYVECESTAGPIVRCFDPDAKYWNLDQTYKERLRLQGIRYKNGRIQNVGKSGEARVSYRPENETDLDLFSFIRDYNLIGFFNPFQDIEISSEFREIFDFIKKNQKKSNDFDAVFADIEHSLPEQLEHIKEQFNQATIKLMDQNGSKDQKFFARTEVMSSHSNIPITDIKSLLANLSYGDRLKEINTHKRILITFWVPELSNNSSNIQHHFRAIIRGKKIHMISQRIERKQAMFKYDNEKQKQIIGNIDEIAHLAVQKIEQFDLAAKEVDRNISPNFHYFFDFFVNFERGLKILPVEIDQRLDLMEWELFRGGPEDANEILCDRAATYLLNMDKEVPLAAETAIDKT